ncbi:MerR family transcriptional regulator [Desulfosporosinus hippei]|nr:MerR family transcriptional regulator [Desulfosporosinus hippei]
MYKIGEISNLAGVSKRTIDYYSTMGLLKPVRAESNYRYYSEESLVRLKFIEDLKSNRFTLEEIKEQLSLLDNKLSQVKQEGVMINTDLIVNQVKQLENQIIRLQPKLINMESNQVALSAKQRMLQSMTLIQALLLYINEITSLI